MRCYFMRGGRIADVELLPGLTDDEAIKKSHDLFQSRGEKDQYEGFELWEQARKIMQFAPDGKGKRQPSRAKTDG